MRRSLLVLMGVTLLGVATAQEGNNPPPPAPPAGSPPTAPSPGSPPPPVPAGAPAGAPAANPGGDPAAAAEAPRGQTRQQRELSEEARDILSIVELPVAAHEARERGVSKKVVKEIVESLREGKVAAAEATRIVKAAARDKNKAEKLGEHVSAKVKEGLRGTELAEAIHQSLGSKKEKGEGKGDGKGEGKEPATFEHGAPVGGKPEDKPDAQGAPPKAEEAKGGEHKGEGHGKGEGKNEGKGKGGH